MYDDLTHGRTGPIGDDSKRDGLWNTFRGSKDSPSRSKGGILVCLNPFERENFLPAELEAELRRLGEPVRILAPPGDTPALTALLNETEARVLVGCWSLPPLPAERSAAPALEYFCYLAGDHRPKVSDTVLEDGLWCTNWGESIGRVVAEHALLLVLMCLRRAAYWSLAMHLEGGWKSKEAADERSLIGRRVGIHGFGAVARALVPMLKPFGCQLAAFSEGPPDELFVGNGVTRMSNLDELFEWAEIVVEAEAHNERTNACVRESHLRALRDGVFVNVARAELVDEDALVRVAKEGRLRIGLDVYHTEPLPGNSPLRGLRNICLLPHIAGPTVDRRIDSGRLALSQIRRYLARQIPLNPLPRQQTV